MKTEISDINIEETEIVSSSKDRKSKRSRKSIQNENDSRVDEDGSIEGAFAFRCPRHVCDTCYQFYVR